MSDLEFLRKIDDLKKKTYTNEAVAKELGVSVSTVKRGLRLINKGALISAMHKFGMTWDLYYFAQEWEELSARVMKEEPELVNKPSYLINKRQADDAKAQRAKGRIETWVWSCPLDPQNEIEKRWLKGYKKWKTAFLRGEVQDEEGLY